MPSCCLEVERKLEGKEKLQEDLPRRPNVLIIGIQTPSNQKAQLILQEEEIIFWYLTVYLQYIGSIYSIKYIVYCGLPEVVDTRQCIDNDSGKFIMVKIDPFLIFIVFVQKLRLTQSRKNWSGIDYQCYFLLIHNQYEKNIILFL